MRRQVQPSITQVGGVIQLLGSAHIIGKESVHVKRGGELCHYRCKVRESVKAPTPGKVLIEAAHHVIEARLVMARMADAQIQEVPEQFSFVVVGDAASHSIII